MKRHSSIGQFVQKGQNRAEIRVTLFNEGDDAYRPEMHGTRIVFERIIYAHGQSIHHIRRGDATNAQLYTGSKCKRLLAEVNSFNLQVQMESFIKQAETRKEKKG